MFDSIALFIALFLHQFAHIYFQLEYYIFIHKIIVLEHTPIYLLQSSLQRSPKFHSSSYCLQEQGREKESQTSITHPGAFVTKLKIWHYISWSVSLKYFLTISSTGKIVQGHYFSEQDTALSIPSLLWAVTASKGWPVHPNTMAAAWESSDTETAMSSYSILLKSASKHSI